MFLKFEVCYNNQELLQSWTSFLEIDGITSLALLDGIYGWLFCDK